MDNVIQGLWIGGQLSIIEQLCIKSFTKNGHEFWLYTYGDVKGIPEGTKIIDANSILPEKDIFIVHNSYAEFADYFRWKLLFEKGGYWVDMDMICLKPFDLKDDIVIGKEDINTSSIGVLKFPKNHFLTEFMASHCADVNKAYPWDRKKIKIMKTIKKALGYIDRESYSWGDIGGPRTLGKALEHFSLTEVGKPYTFFYPVHFVHWKYIFDDTLANDFGLFKDTYGIHLWNEMLRQDGIDKNSKFYSDKSLFNHLLKKYM
jgi:hypothetical protein